MLPVVASFVSTWIPPFERILLGGMVYCGTNLGIISSNVFTGLIIDLTDSWPMAFYIWSGIASGYCVLHLLYVYSFPAHHPNLSTEELDYLNKFLVPKRKLKTPWRKIFTNIPFWANLSGHTGHNYIFHTLFTYLPTYMKEILQFDITQNGLYSSAPFMALWLSAITLSITGNYIVHSMRCMNPLMFTRIFGLVSNVGSALLMASAVHVGCSRAWTIAFYIMAMAIKSFYYMTININTNELSRNYGGILFGVCNFVGCLCAIGGNAFIGAVTKNRKISEWQLVFWVNLGVAVGTSIIFFILSSSERQAFDYDEEEETPPSGH
ncbi:putative inorganic phosphate cotransporter [Sitophilus oryzae]|uniref:Inorganic phosphate cotransporter n=1 Tax=Sitophilus oryzae TaxID=7048 RepID=A0A6J2XRU3_SITOR|nr:putative inorganic phosphate cotransporter [Sitophilus oryzae]